ncbi:DNA-binding transcriptional regulator YiaG, XRE-type HTH domain [Nostoc flagelliforme CCNUN1]|uniref:DNA-binding transcriptional regulator YiaG, XRE-type HTH domain n=1 Tax=Nostoc flagelliforme CCNUN1 TaxID=2038116 RepID=A0A2K8SXS5_9NOSO|nr:toll/interleukin-1 receptor domain-containing protein [Nostoc flagelliforme]AUB40232.1 DNA-binding transcriptional regulator YiaG, XRE-type HTH domain [Nostoc flagelliforme CCNUN1]
MEKFDVFLCHNSKDKPAVIEVAEQLQQQGIVPWLDIWHLRPGFSWQRALEDQIDQIGAVAVFVGGSGLGPWQSQEIDAFLRAFVNRQCPVIPVLLPEFFQLCDRCKSTIYTMYR